MVKAKRSAPMKVCSSCGAENHARTRICKKCQHEFPLPAAKSAKSSAGGVDVERFAMEFALLTAGSLDKAIKLVEGYTADDVAMFVEKAGGADRALSALRKLVEKKQ